MTYMVLPSVPSTYELPSIQPSDPDTYYCYVQGVLYENKPVVSNGSGLRYWVIASTFDFNKMLMTDNAPVTAKKYDQNYNERWDLLPLPLIQECTRVMSHGAKKYGPNTWQTIANAKDRYYAALMRHISAWRNGETTDSDSGCSHLAHTVVNALFLDYFDNNEA